MWVTDPSSRSVCRGDSLISQQEFCILAGATLSEALREPDCGYDKIARYRANPWELVSDQGMTDDLTCVVTVNSY